MKPKQPLTPAQRIAKAKQQLAAGSPDYAQAHALIALAESVIAWLWTPDAEPPEPEPIVTWQEKPRMSDIQFGADAAIEIQAQAFDAIIPGLGEALRLAWELCMADLRTGLAAIAASSGAEHELEFYEARR